MDFLHIDDHDDLLKELEVNTSNEELKADEASNETGIKKRRGRPKSDSENKQIKPITAFLVFSQDISTKIKEKNPEFKLSEQRKLLSDAWSQLNDQDKLIWRQKAKQERKKFQQENEDENSAKVKKSRKSYKNESSEEFVTDCKPIDIAAHLALLSESLASIGHKLKSEQTIGQNTTDLLLDSLLYSLGSLLCVTSHVTQLNGCSKELLEKIQDNVSLLI